MLYYLLCRKIDYRIRMTTMMSSRPTLHRAKISQSILRKLCGSRKRSTVKAVQIQIETISTTRTTSNRTRSFSCQFDLVPLVLLR